MLGPFPVVGDCVSDEERHALAYIDHEPLRDGDLAIWYMPSREPGEQYASKWLIADSAGGLWIACKYFAVRYRPEFHVPVARVVLILAGESGSFDPELSAKMAGEIRSLRANPPERADMVVFHEDILEHGEIVAAIDQHRRQSN
jgi:hypothetical protein